MKCPAGLWILGKYWRIEPVEGFYRDEDCYGDCVHSQLRIRIDAEICDQQARDTLLHEIIHSIEKELGLKVTEQVVRNLATGLIGVMRDNPDLMKFLLGNLESAQE